MLKEKVATTNLEIEQNHALYGFKYPNCTLRHKRDRSLIRVPNFIAMGYYEILKKVSNSMCPPAVFAGWSHPEAFNQ